MSAPDRIAISDEERDFFLENGYLTLRGVLQGEELRRVQAAMDELTAYGSAEVRNDPDYMYGRGPQSGKPVLRRIEYVIDKRDEMKVLLGHPFILRSVEKLMGSDFISTWDSMVLKMPGEGIIVPWHRDAGTDYVGDKPIFNVDFYLDEADEDTCVWVLPGSHLWSREQVQNGSMRTASKTPRRNTSGRPKPYRHSCSRVTCCSITFSSCTARHTTCRTNCVAWFTTSFAPRTWSTSWDRMCPNTFP